jgi:16S rRNA processing protein RimM
MVQRATIADRRVCIGVIAGPHGVNGLVRVKSFTADPADVAAYGPVTDVAGSRQFRIRLTGMARDMLIARIEGVKDRNAAEALRGVELYVDRNRLPEAGEDEFYHADLIGMPARSKDGSEIGTVTALYDYGAGDVIEIRMRAGGVELLPFNKATVPNIDLDQGFVVIDPPVATEARAEDAVDDERVEAGA